MENNKINNTTDNVRGLMQKMTSYVNTYEDHSSTEERQVLWSKIENEVALRRVRAKRIRLFSAVASVAAIIALVIVISPIVQSSSESDLSNIAMNFEVDVDNLDNVQLIMSPNDIILVDDGSLVSHSNNGTVMVNAGIVDTDELVESGEVDYNKLIVPNGKRVSLLLLDGSKLEINAGTKVVYPRVFRKDRREIFVDGEVYITVAPNEKVPFIVKTAKFDVEVLGTAFNINSYSVEKNSRSEIVLVHGKVKVKDQSGMNIMMKPNQLVSLINGGIDECKNVDVSQYISWRYGIINFNGVPLKNIFDQLVKYYGVDINYDIQGANIIVYGKLDLDQNFDEVLRQLSLTTSFTYKYNTDADEYYINL